MLNIICGSAGSGKSRFIYSKIAALAKEGAKSLLIVPESMSHVAERRLLLSCGNSVGRYARVTTLSHLADDILFSCGINEKFLDNGGRVLSMYRAICELGGELTYYGDNLRRPALVSSMLDMVNEFIASGISDSELAEVGSRMSPKMRDISMIYTSYLSICRQSVLDPAMMPDIASQNLLRSGLLSGVNVFFDDFSSYSEQKMRFMENIIQQSEQAYFTLLTNGDCVTFHEQEKLKRRLLSAASRLGKKSNVIELPLPKDQRAPELEALEPMFDPHAPVYNGAVNAVEMFTAKNIFEECELAAAKIRFLILEKGYRLRDIAVVTGSEEAYAAPAENAFMRYGIPCFFSRREDVLKKPAFAAALGPLQCLCDGLRTDSVLTYIKCGILGLDDDAVCKLENYALMWGTQGKAWLTPFTKPTSGFDMPYGDEERRLSFIEQTRAKAMEPVAWLSFELEGCKTGADFAGAFVRYLEHCNMRVLFERRMRALSDAGLRQEAAEYAQLYEILIGALTQFEGVCGSLTMDSSEFLQLLELTLSQYDVSTIPTSSDCVTFGSYARFSSFGVKHLFLLGACSAYLPPDTPSSSILSESEREALEQEDICLPRSEDKALSQQSDVYRVFNAPQNSLTLIRPLQTGDGSVMAESYINTYVKKILPDIEEKPADKTLAYLRLTAPEPAFELACSAANKSTAPSPQALAARSFLAKDPAMSEKFDFLEKYALSPREVIKDADVLRRLYGRYLSVSASAIEKFNACHFQHFLQYGLRVKERKPASIGALEAGTMVHWIVENAVRALHEQEYTDPAECAEYYTDQYAATLKGADTPRMQAVIAQIRENAAFVIRDVWDEILASKFKPAYFELNFARGGDLEPITWELDGFSFMLKGKIDRVDRYGDYLKVVDYKTGTKKYALGDILLGKNLQPFIYMYMLKKAGLGENCAALFLPATAEYIPTKHAASDTEAAELRQDKLRRLGLVRSEPEILEALEPGSTSGAARWLPLDFDSKKGCLKDSSRIASGSQMDRLILYTEKQIMRFSKEVSSGDISIAPCSEEICRWCSCKAACHFDQTLNQPLSPAVYSTANTEKVIAKIEEEEAQEDGRL